MSLTIRRNSVATLTAALSAILTAAVLSGCSAPGSSASPPGTPAESARPASPAKTAVSASGGTDPLSTDENPWWQHVGGPVPSPTPVEVPRTERYRLNGAVLFEANTSGLTAGAASQLEIILTAHRLLPRSTLTVDGYTNPVPGGNSQRSLTLSAERAESVKAWFVAHGVTAARISTRGWGDTRPLYPADTDEHRAANRRCEITLTPHR
ncbi:OmpA family protein [Paenarthrobacter sp. DKR-5]|uniref:OmpA family protein n=1 Tax=Paenarthrobacter sp. DKR-5 TaxID=2835535 RepID=UPI001BDCF29E|nr:OmpA family protein [Paenarthrobacter sp. DKR-5]MBT1003950.1 OmpA family protein [Paenarthrobacter sp. DKR-5]